MAINTNQVLLLAYTSSLLLALLGSAHAASKVAPNDVKFIEANMIAGRQKTAQHLKVMDKRAKDPVTDASSLQCIKQCKEVYLAAMSDMKSGIEAVKSGDYHKASSDISAASTNVDTCLDCYNEMSIKEDAQVKQFDKWVLGITSDSLAKLHKYTLN